MLKKFLLFVAIFLFATNTARAMSIKLFHNAQADLEHYYKLIASGKTLDAYNMLSANLKKFAIRINYLALARHKKKFAVKHLRNH